MVRSQRGSRHPLQRGGQPVSLCTTPPIRAPKPPAGARIRDGGPAPPPGRRSYARGQVGTGRMVRPLGSGSLTQAGQTPMMIAMITMVTNSWATLSTVSPVGRPSNASCVMKRAAVNPAQRMMAVSRALTKKLPP
jgi:hypothetical protein